jgi:hypothetical protein
MQIQKDLDDYKTLNPEFPVSHLMIALRSVTNRAKRDDAAVAHDELPTSIGLVCGRPVDGPGRAVLARIHLSGYDQRSLTCTRRHDLYVSDDRAPVFSSLVQLTNAFPYVSGTRSRPEWA